MKSLSLTFIFILGFFFLTGQDTFLYEDNFDNYSPGTSITSVSADWKPWSGLNAPASQKAFVDSAQSFSQPNSLFFLDDNNIIYDFKDQTKGRHQISFKIRIQDQMGAHINVQHEFSKNWAFTLIFQDNNSINFRNGREELLISDYTSDSWHQMMFDINIDIDSLTLYMDDNKLGEFSFQRSESGTYSRKLDCINFFGQNGNSQEYINHSAFYIDDFRYEGVIYNPPMAEIENAPIITAGEEKTVSVTNTGELALSYRMYPVYDPHSSFAGQLTSEIITHNVGDYPDFGQVGWQADKIMKYIVRFYPEDLIGKTGLKIDSVKTFIGDFNYGKATLFLLDKGSTVDKFNMGEVLFELEYDDIQLNEINVFNVEFPFTIDGEEFSMGIETVCPGLYNYMVPLEDFILPKDRQYRNYYFLDNKYFDLPNPIFMKLYVSGQTWPEWLQISEGNGFIAPGANKNFQLSFHTDGLEAGNSYHATIHFTCNDPELEFTEIPVTLDIISNTDERSNTGVLLFPNPVEDYFSLQSDKSIRELSLLNEAGQLIYRCTEPNRFFRINLHPFDGNVFFIQMNIDGEIHTKKLVRGK